MYSWTAVLPPSHRSIHRICNMAPMCTPFLETALKRHLDQFSHLCTAHPRAQHTRTRRRTVKYNRPYLCCTCDAAYNLHTGMKYFSSGIISGYVDWILLMSLSLSIPFRAVCFCYGQFNAIRRHYVTGYCGVCNCILVRQCVVILWVMLSVWMNQQLVISSDVSSIWSSLHVLNYAFTCALQQPYTAGTQSCRRLPKI